MIERILQMSEFEKGQHYNIQYTTDVGRVDFIVHLPGNRNVILDSKTLLDSLQKSIAAKDEADKSYHMDEYVRLSRTTSGGAIRVNPVYTSQTCSLYLHVDEDSRCGILFRCVSCGFIHHADINSGCNIENGGRKKFGLPRRFIKSLHTLPDYICTASGIGQ